MLSSLDSPACATPYLVHTPHRTVHLQQRPPTRCHPTPPFVQLVRKPPFAFDSPSLDLAGQVMASSHPVHLAFNDNLLGTTHSRVASSCQPLPSDLGLPHYLPAAEKGGHCPATPDQSQSPTWPLPTGAGCPPGMMTSRPWLKPTGLTPEVFLPGGNSQPYNNLLLEPTDTNPTFSPDSEAFNPAAFPTAAATPILTAIPYAFMINPKI
ncbi:hypothetical protein BC826DRAFT_271258 [Russula brevipes]|nr:hypothetical protein BC826DRAFT_271258 [Russula brevipes]